jgi:hypothetical protein
MPFLLFLTGEFVVVPKNFLPFALYCMQKSMISKKILTKQLLFNNWFWLAHSPLIQLYRTYASFSNPYVLVKTKACDGMFFPKDLNS